MALSSFAIKHGTRRNELGTELKRDKLIVGARQSMKALVNGNVSEVYMAEDSDEFIKNDFIRECSARDINIVRYRTKAELGRDCGIEIGAAVACRTI
jgi:large subunit ribosomal protein L7A